MADSPLLKIPLLSQSQSAKEATINTMVGMLESSMNDAKTVNMGGGNLTLPAVDLARYFMFRMAAVGSSSTLTISPMKRLFVIENLTSAFNLNVTNGVDSLVIPLGGVVIVYCDGVNLISVADSTVMGGSGGSVTSFVSLIDTFSSYASLAGHFLRVNASEDGIEAHAILLSDLTDVDTTGISDGYSLQWDATDTKWIVVDPSSGGTVDIGALIKPPTDVATIEDIDLAAGLAAGTVLDGVLLTLDMRVLVKDQTDLTENGIYIVNAGAATRATDANATGDFVRGSLVVVNEGLLGGKRIFMQTSQNVPGGITPGTAELVFESSGMPFMSQIRDVDLTGLANGYGLLWNAETQRWEAQPVEGGGGGPGSSNIAINLQTADYILVFTDAGKYIKMNAAGVNTVTVPTNASVAFDIGTQIVIRQSGAGKTAILPAGGVTINTPETLSLRKQHSTATLVKVGTNEWDVVGDLELA